MPFFFVNVNKSSFAEIVHKQSKSASFVKLVEIHNVETLKFSLIRAPVHLHNLRVGTTIGSSFPVPQLKRQANHEQLSCTQCSKFIVCCPIPAIARQY